MNYSISELISKLTFGAFGDILNIKLPNNKSNIGSPFIFEKLGFFPSDLNNRRFFSYVEAHPHIEKIAWDKRIISLLVNNHIRRDFYKKLSSSERETGGTLSFGETNQFVENYTNRLNLLKTAIEEFRDVLMFHSDDNESTFHELLQKHPILLDVYGDCESKPRFVYPKDNSSPIGKKYVEPDFIITYPDQSYKLIEIEKAAKNVATIQGQPRAEISQAIFQTAEWKHYIKEHYSIIKDKYPGIHTKYTTSLIISRSTQKSFKGIEDMNRYKELIINQFSIGEVLTYDDLLDKVVKMYNILTGLSPTNL